MSELEHPELLGQIVDLVSTKFMPIITRHALSGRARLVEDRILGVHVIDLFSERGYHAVVDKQIHEIPERIDLTTGLISYHSKVVYRIQIHFEASKIRRG